MQQPIAIIGGGIAGLTTALALKKAHFPVRIYESASEIKPVGAGIVMAINAMQIFEKLGVREKIEDAGNRISTIQMTDDQMNPLSVMDLAKFEKKYGVCNVAIHRADLQSILSREVGFENIELSKRLLNIRKAEGWELEFENGEIINAPVVIGADGIHSKVRSQVFGFAAIRNAGQVCWRGISEMNLLKEQHHHAIEMWGKGKRFGFTRINKREVYWFAVVNDKMVKNEDTALSGLFSGFHEVVLKLMAATPEGSVFKNNLSDLKPVNKWQQGNVCLIGDAAHATTPNMGQGACQAVEDAYVLSELLLSGKSVNDAFADYERLRMKRAQGIVIKSWRLGKAAHIENDILVHLRKRLMKVTPSFVHERLMEKVFDINYRF